MGGSSDVAWRGADGVALWPRGSFTTTLGAGRFPSLISLKRHTLVAWEDQGRVHVRSVPR